jgi:hydroxypyruvate isomerase
MIEWSAHLSTLYRDVPVAGRPAAAARDGARAVETWWVEGEDQDRWVEAVHAADVEVVVITAHAGDLAAGERGFLNIPERHRTVTADVLAAIELAARCGAPFVNVLVGKDTGESGREGQLDLVRGMLAELAGPAAEAGVVLLVEAQNPLEVPGYLLPDAGSVAKLVEQVGSGSVALLYDAYHAAAVGCAPERELIELDGAYAHVQYADFPGRGPVGSGSVPLASILDALVKVGYAGRVGLEYFPDVGSDGAGDPLAAIRKLAHDGAAPLGRRRSPR